MSYEFNMVDMGGIDIATVNGTVVEGLYNKLLEGMDACGNLILYNWKFAEIEIVPRACSILIEDDAIIVNGTIRVSSEDVISLIWADPPPAPVSPIVITSNGEYIAEPPVSGFNPVIVQVPSPVSDNDLLFHFDDFTNSGKMNAAFYNKTGYLISDEQSKFGGTSLKVDSSPSAGGAVWFEGGFTLADQDFTLDFWVMQTVSVEDSNCFFAFNYRSFAYYSRNGLNRGVDLASSPGSWAIARGGRLQDVNILNSWHHFAVTREGSVFRVFCDGIIEDQFNWAGSFAPMTRLSFGTNANDRTAWRGYIDEFRLKIGEAVWTSDFTPPTEPYT